MAKAGSKGIDVVSGKNQIWREEGANNVKNRDRDRQAQNNPALPLVFSQGQLDLAGNEHQGSIAEDVQSDRQTKTGEIDQSFIARQDAVHHKSPGPV